MEEIEIPSVRERAMVSDALEKMRKNNRAVVCADLRNGPRLLFIEDLLRIPREERGTTTIGDIGWGTETVGVPIPGGSINLAAPQVIRRGFDATLSGSGKRFAVVGFNGDQARVVAAADDLSRLLRPFPEEGVDL